MRGPSFLDRMQRMVYRTVCDSAVWFDSFFGDERAYEESDTPSGRVGVALGWEDRDEIQTDFTFKARVALPRAENRLNAFLRRGDRDDYVTDRGDSIQTLPTFFGDSLNDEWLVGLGYNPYRSSRRRIDFDAGIKLDLPPEPFVKARYRGRFLTTKNSLGRFRQTVFWELDEGFGTTSRIDLERLLGPRYLIRWRNVGTFAQFSEGIDWQSSLTLYQHLGGSRAIAYQVGAFGETDLDVPLEEYGLRVIFRHSFLREWFFLEWRGSLTWPREKLHEDRDANPGFLFGFEMKFGRDIS